MIRGGIGMTNSFVMHIAIMVILLLSCFVVIGFLEQIETERVEKAILSGCNTTDGRHCDGYTDDDFYAYCNAPLAHILFSQCGGR